MGILRVGEVGTTQGEGRRGARAAGREGGGTRKSTQRELAEHEGRQEVERLFHMKQSSGQHADEHDLGTASSIRRNECFT